MRTSAYTTQVFPALPSSEAFLLGNKVNELKWLRLYTEIIDDEKIRLLAFEDRWHYVAILCLKQSGVIDSENPELKQRKMAVKLGLSLSELDSLNKRLSDVELIQSDWTPVGWADRQFLSDSSTGRVRKYREKLKKEPEKRNGNVSVTTQETETETETEKTTPCASASRKAPAGYKFEDFWKIYPLKRNKKKSLEIWKRKNLDENAEDLITDVQNRINHDTQWKSGFILHCTTYLNGHRWEDSFT